MIDAGGGYTYLNPQTGHEFSGVLGFTYNFTNQSTQYQNGVDMHFDWAASQFLAKVFQVGVVGYVYREVGCDSGSDRVGCFQSQVVGAGPQLGFIIPLTTETQGYLNLKSYWEFTNQNRPAGWNGWVTFVISSAEQRAARRSSAERRLGLRELSLLHPPRRNPVLRAWSVVSRAPRLGECCHPGEDAIRERSDAQCVSSARSRRLSSQRSR